jgi:hypothetical protein
VDAWPISAIALANSSFQSVKSVVASIIERREERKLGFIFEL